MSMQFKPKTEKEIKEAALAPEGEYDFEVLGAEDTASKKTGAPMIKVTLGLYSGESIRWRVTDYLLAAMEAKLRHFCDGVGLLSKYEFGSLCAADCLGRSGKLKLSIKQDKTGTYPDQNAVKDYIVRPAKPLQSAPAKPANIAAGESDNDPF